MDKLDTQEDKYHLWIPIQEGVELTKSVEVDKNGDYIVQGVMTSDEKDEEDDSITPEGMDCSYFLDKGWIKYEHGNSPNQFIGEPLEVKVGQFNHPKLNKSVNGIFVKGRLFAQRELAKQAVKTIEDLQKSNTKRCMGWSIEGSVRERDRKTGKILKSVLRNVVLTMNPVNTITWAELSKSFAKNHELTISMDEPVEKAMDIATAQAIMPQSVEGATTDPQEDWVKMFRKFCKSRFLEKSLRNKFITSGKGEVELDAFTFAVSEELDYEEANEFASYIAEKHTILKSLLTAKCGGETMNKLANLLDTDLEELQKSLELETEEGEEETSEEELEKSMDKDEDENDENDENDDNDDANDDANDDDNDDANEDNDEETEKSFKTEFSKSLATDTTNAQAFEVSDFLLNISDEIGFHMDGFQKSMGLVTKQQNVMIKSFGNLLNVVQEMATQLEEVKAHNEELQKSLAELGERPVGRKSVVNQREVTTLQKSVGTEVPKPKNRNEVTEILLKSFEAGEIGGTVVSRFEAGVPLESLNLPETVKGRLGL